MRKTLFTILTICLFNLPNLLHAQCTPDTSFKTSGTIPAALDTAKVGILYQQTIQYHITKDTMVYVAQLGQTVNAKIDTLWITGVVGMPNGFTYSCHNAGCKILGGKTGCATLTGTATQAQAGIYPLIVLINIRATAFIGPIPVGQNVSDTNSRYTMVVEGASGLSTIDSYSEVILYPNPARDELQVYLPAQKELATYSIKNMQGMEVLAGNLLPQGEVSKIGLNQSKGVYFIEINTASKHLVKKFMIQ
ncbi:MAG: T9SS type A sorting domain-containing protein [bacterium]|nr:T9SS type A sorting domain-containing protein [bacterium]